MLNAFCANQIKKGKEILTRYLFLLSDSIPYKDLATADFTRGAAADTLKKIASRNQDIVSKPRVMSNASAMIPIRANSKPRHSQNKLILNQTLISFFTSSRSLNGFSAIDITSSFNFLMDGIGFSSATQLNTVDAVYKRENKIECVCALKFNHTHIFHKS
jgi:hypothetical protein